MGIFSDIGKWIDGALDTIASPFTTDFGREYPEGTQGFEKHFPDWFKDHPTFSDRSVAVWEDGTQAVEFTDASGSRWSVKREPDGDVEWQVYDRGDREWRDPEEGEEVTRSISQAQENPPDDLSDKKLSDFQQPTPYYPDDPSDQKVSDVLGGPPKTYNPPDLSDQKVSDVLGGPPKTFNPGPPRPETGETLDPIPSSGPSPFGPPDPNNPTTPPPNYGSPIPSDKPIGDVLGGPPKTFNPSEPAPPSGTAGGSEAEEIQAKQRAEELARYEQAQNPDLAKQRAEELERYEQAQGPQNPPGPSLEDGEEGQPDEVFDPRPAGGTAIGDASGGPNTSGIISADGGPVSAPANTSGSISADGGPVATPGDPNAPEGQQSPGGDDAGGIPGMGVPYRDFMPFAPMVKDPTTGEWRNAYESEGGYTPDPEGGEVPTLPGDLGEAAPTPPGGPEAEQIQAQQRAEELERYQQLHDQPAPEDEYILDPIPSSGPSPFGDPQQPAPPPSGGAGGSESSPEESVPAEIEIEAESAEEITQTMPPIVPDYAPLPEDRPIGEVLGEAGQKTYNPPDGPRLVEEPAPAPPVPDPEPMQTLDAALLDPTAPGPTLDHGLVERIEQNPQLVDRVNQNQDVARALERDPTSIDQIEQDLGFAEPSSVMGPAGVTDPSVTDPSLTEPPAPEPSRPDQDLDDTVNP